MSKTNSSLVLSDYQRTLTINANLQNLANEILEFQSKTEFYMRVMLHFGIIKS